jgi:hypothetical protein
VTVAQKVALSLLISVFLFAGFTVLAFTGLFDLVETRFYNPSITRGLTEDINRDAETIQDFLTELQSRFSATLRESPVRRSFLPNQSAEDIFERTRIYGVLLESLGGLQWVRFIDAGGSRIHYSTYPQDLVRQDRLSVVYRNYTDNPENPLYGQVEVSREGSMKITTDEKRDRIIFSFPFYDSFDVYRGTALFSLSLRALTERLIHESRIKVGENVSLLSAPSGIVSGLPSASKDILLPMVASIWNDGILSLSALDSAGSGITLALITAKTVQGIFVGRLVDESIFSFPQAMKIILLASFFSTVYLTIFLIFNMRQDIMTVIENRLKRLQLSLIEQYYDRREDMDWGRWRHELAQRREEIRAELKQGLGAGKQNDKDIDILIDKSWDELLAAIGSRQNPKAAVEIDDKKLQMILDRIIRAASADSPAVSGDPVPAEPEIFSRSEELEELEGFEESDENELAAELEELNGTGETKEMDAELAEVIKELEYAESTQVAEPFQNAEFVKSAATGSIEIGKGLNAEEVNAAEAILARSPQRKRSNVRLAFGDDDIPYFVESSGLELVDEDFDSALLGGANQEEGPAAAAGTDAERPAEEPEDLEELEEMEELEEVEEPDTAEESEQTPEQDLDKLAHEIEFGPTPEPEEDIFDTDNEELEIVSPFADIFSNFSDADMEGQGPDEEEGESFGEDKKHPSAKMGGRKDNSKKGVFLEELDNKSGMSLVYHSFFLGNNQTPEFLEVLRDPLPAVIEERDGLHFINRAVLYAPENAKPNLDPRFKDLVDSVLK